MVPLRLADRERLLGRLLRLVVPPSSAQNVREREQRVALSEGKVDLQRVLERLPGEALGSVEVASIRRDPGAKRPPPGRN
jgi:hypothetical protein